MEAAGFLYVEVSLLLHSVDQISHKANPGSKGGKLDPPLSESGSRKFHHIFQQVQFLVAVSDSLASQSFFVLFCFKGTYIGMKIEIHLFAVLASLISSPDWFS